MPSNKNRNGARPDQKAPNLRIEELTIPLPYKHKAFGEVLFYYNIYGDLSKYKYNI